MPCSNSPQTVRTLRAAACLLALSPTLAQCDRNPPTGEAPKPQTAAPAPPVLPAPTPALDRSALLVAVDIAAFAYAAGQAPTGSDPLVGRDFDVRLAFACGGPRPASLDVADHGIAPPARSSEGLPIAQWGSKGQTIQLTLAPADWTRSTLLSSGGEGGAWEAAEGVWITNPWLRAEGCPSVAGDPLQTSAAPISPQTVGLAAVFDAGGSRVGRRDGRAYSFTVRGQGDGAPPVAPNGYRARLTGRVLGFPNGRAVRCQAAGPEQRPVCVAAVRLDRVAFETVEGQVMSEWTSG